MLKNRRRDLSGDQQVVIIKKVQSIYNNVESNQKKAFKHFATLKTCCCEYEVTQWILNWRVGAYQIAKLCQGVFHLDFLPDLMLNHEL